MEKQQVESTHDLSVKVTKELDNAVRAFVHVEQFRSYRQIVIYLLDSFVAATRLDPTVYLWVKIEPAKTRMRGHVRANIPSSLYRAILKKSTDYGMEIPEFTRIALATSLSTLASSVPERAIISKEELGARIVGYLKKMN